MKVLRRCVLALALGSLTAPAAGAAGTPAEAVRASLEAVLATLDEDGDDEPSRRERVLDEIAEAFDFTAMSRRVLATGWHQASAEQRIRFAALFERILANTYWRRLQGYSGQTVEIVGERLVDEDTARVRTQIKAGGHSVAIDYSLQLTGGRWLVYDVIIEGVSLVRNYRLSYREIAAKEGLEGLLERMQSKADASDDED